MLESKVIQSREDIKENLKREGTRWIGIERYIDKKAESPVNIFDELVRHYKKEGYSWKEAQRKAKEDLI